MKREIAKFKLVETPEFDARRGYARGVTPGVVIRTSNRGSLATADVWIDREGKLVARFTSVGYHLHFEIQPVESDRIIPDDQAAIESFLEDQLQEWVMHGVDNDWWGE